MMDQYTLIISGEYSRLQGCEWTIKTKLKYYIRMIMEAELPASVSEAFAVFEMGHSPLPKNLIDFRA